MNYLELAGSVIGLVYLWLEYKASIYLWLASIVMSAIYIVVYYQAGLYADFGINIYFLLASCYGWMAWLSGRKEEERAGGIFHFDRRLILPATGVFLLIFGLIGWVLVRFTDSNVPWWDSFTTAASIIAMWMLARKYAEQWLVWIAVDVVSCGLYIYKDLPFTAALYGLYALIACFGYLKWLKMIERKNEQ